jgi:hypothetical protein
MDTSDQGIGLEGISKTALSREVAVDVVVIPAEFKPGTWTLSDRLGRPLGTIAEVPPSLFVINAAPGSGLSRMASASFLSLHDAMTAISRHMKGECQISRPNEKRR